ncbi:MAG: polyphenol oxidase family protein, partial [Myxococcota bacterium]
MVDVLHSSLLRAAGFRHGFSLRTGGRSEAPFASANLGRGLGDDPSCVAANHRLFAKAVGYARLYELSQVHGSIVRRVRADEDPIVVRQEDGDALVAREAGIAVGVRVADCIPLLAANIATGGVAAIHAGWRGVEARIAEQALKTLAAGQLANLRVAIGPHIRVANFEVGAEVAARLAAVAHGQDVVDRTFAKPHVDLTRVLRAQLRSLGIREEFVEDVGGATYADPERFFSYRRDG